MHIVTKYVIFAPILGLPSLNGHSLALRGSTDPGSFFRLADDSIPSLNYKSDTKKYHVDCKSSVVTVMWQLLLLLLIQPTFLQLQL